MRHLPAIIAAIGLLSGALPAASAAEPESCRSVQMADPGWTDIGATNAMAGVVLRALGYEQKVSKISVPMTYVGLQKDQVDVFLGNWMPAQRDTVEPLVKENKIHVVRDNLSNAKFTLAVPDYVAAAGVKNFSDLAKFAPKFDKKIYGIDSGSPANQNIKRMLGAKSYGLEGWSVVESSEQGMLSEVARKVRTKDWIVFLAWEPHQMNLTYNLTYLDGDKDYFGPNFGSATVRTVARKGFAEQCPNLAKFFSQLVFTTDMESRMIVDVLEKKKDINAAAAEQLKAHPEMLERWLAGVTTRTGESSLSAVRKVLAQH